MKRRSGDRKGVLQNAHQELGYADGTFRFAQLPGGEYFLAALSAEAPDDWRLPSFLRDVIAHAVGVDGRAAIRVGPVLDAFPGGLVVWGGTRQRERFNPAVDRLRDVSTGRAELEHESGNVAPRSRGPPAPPTRLRAPPRRLRYVCVPRADTCRTRRRKR